MLAYTSSCLSSIPTDQTVIIISFSKHNFSSENFDFRISISETIKLSHHHAIVHRCVPQKPDNILYGAEAVLVRCQRPSKVLSHLSTKFIFLFMDHLCRQPAQILISPLGLWG